MRYLEMLVELKNSLLRSAADVAVCVNVLRECVR